MRINSRDDVGDSGYGVPYNVEPEKLKLAEEDIDFVMAIETGGMFDRLVENGFDEEARCALVHLKGQPSCHLNHNYHVYANFLLRLSFQSHPKGA